VSKFDRRKKPVEKCGQTRKRIFKSHESAVEFVIGRADTMPVVMRAYPCQFCGGWHLTSKDYI
jgi:hypothetical protein